MAGIPERTGPGGLEPRRSTLAVLDNALLVVVVVVAALVVLKVIGFIAGTVFFLIKLGIVAGVIYAIVRLLTRRR
jgi:hypothetical protein